MKIQVSDTYIFNRFFDPMVKLSNGIVNDHEEARDIALEGLTKILMCDKDFDSIEVLYSYLKKTVHNASIDFLRRRRVINRFIKQTDCLAYETPKYIDLHKEGTSELQIINTAIETLPRKCKKIISLYFEGLKTNEICDRLNLAEGTVRRQKMIAIDKIKEALLKKH